MCAMGVQKRPEGSTGDSHPRFVHRHATGLTTVLFIGLCAALGSLPHLPAWTPEGSVKRALEKLGWDSPGLDFDEVVRPVDLRSPESVTAMIDRVLRQPKMTFTIPDAEPTEAPAEDKASPDVLPPPAPVLVSVVPQDRVRDPSRPRRDLEATAEVKRLRRIAKALKAPGADVDNPCVQQNAAGCLETAMDAFYGALDDVAAGVPGSHASVLTLGNSLIASDHVTDIVRERLVETFGDGGRGFLLPDRLSKVAGRRVRTGRSTPGWRINTFAQKPPKRAHFGFTGSHHESTRKGDRVSWSTRGATEAKLFFLDHKKAASFRVQVDGKTIEKVASQSPDEPSDRVLTFDLPDDAKKLSVVADGKGVVLYGVSLTGDRPGVSWDTIGVPASDAEMYVTKADPGIFQRQLKERDPNLVVVMVGGNEIRSLAFGWTTLEEVRKHYSTLIDRVQDALPDASCLAVAPIDAAKATAAGAQLTTRKEVASVVALEREIALEKGCAFFNLWQAMGAKGSLHRFHRAGFVNDDLVHPKGKGGDVLGEFIADGLFANYLATPRPQVKKEKRRRLVFPAFAGLSFPGVERTAPLDEHPLAPVISAFNQAERRKGQGRVAVGMFGDEHVEGQLFADRLKTRLAERVGDRGRGLVGIGDHDPRLLTARVVRRLRGPHNIVDGRDVVLGGAMSLFGTSTQLQPGAKLELRFCDGCRKSPVLPKGRLDVSWLYTPDMGKAVVLVNDVEVGTIEPDQRTRRDSDVQVLTVPVRGERHRVTIQVPNEDDNLPVTLLSVAQELDRPGVVVDAVGLASATGMTMQRWQQDLLLDQAEARDYNLLVLGWGAVEERIPGLDEVTYRHHYRRTVATLKKSSPHAACVLVGPFPQGPDENDESLVAVVQASVAEEMECAHFSPRRALTRAARPDGQAPVFVDGEGLSPAGLQLVGDALAHDLLSFLDYAREKAVRDAEAEQAAEIDRNNIAKAPPAPGANPPAAPQKKGDKS